MTYQEARDELFGIANTAIKANIAIVGGTFDMRWPGMSKPGVYAPTAGYYGRINLNTVRDEQVSLAKLAGVSRYEALGQLLIRVFSPIALEDGLKSGNMFAEALRNAYRQPSPTGWLKFTNQLVREVGNDDTHYITNVSVTCTFENIQ